MALVSTYIDPETGIFYNKLGIRDAAVLRRAEYLHVAGRAEYLEISPIPGKFDLAHLCAIHEYLFQDIYHWAGMPRTVNISKGDSLFCACDMLEYYMGDIHKRLGKDNFLRGLDSASFMEKFTEFFGDVNALHPFREGNGRSTRVFIGQLARQAGYQFNRDKIAQDPARWNFAASLAHSGKMDAMKAIFSETLSPICE